MAREYSINAAGLTVSAAKTLIFINVGTTRAIEILRFWVGFKGTATGEMVKMQAVTQVSAFPTLTSYTPLPLKLGDAASAITGGTAGAAGTCGINASAEGAGAKTVRFQRSFYNLNGTEWLAGPHDSIVLAPSGSAGFGLYIPVAPTTTSEWDATLIFRELG